MKELTIEEKAKAYDETLERARVWKDKSGMPKDKQGILDDIFPELKESEDEKIRKSLITFFQRFPYERIDAAGTNVKKAIAWLEKQGSEPNWCHHKVDLSNCSEEYRKAYYDGWNNCNMQHSQCNAERNDVVKCLINGMKFYYEDNKEAMWGTDKWSMPVKHIIEVLENMSEQKPADKVEPKFKVGDCVVGKYISGYISEVRDDCYLLDYQGFPIDKQDNYHLWTIQDAKDGDVIFYDDGWTCIFKHIHGIWYSSYCFITADGEFHTGYERHAIDAKINGNVHPATKEQRDLLFQKMREAGYGWNAEKKELKKIVQNNTDEYIETKGLFEIEAETEELAKKQFDKQKPVDKIEPKFKIGDTITVKPMSCHGKVFKGEPFKIVDIIEDNYVSDDGKTYSISLQDGWELVQQNPAWSEEDEKKIDSIIETIRIRKFEHPQLVPVYDGDIDWLKSLKDRVQPQKQWKPSDEQMQALNAINVTGGISYAGQGQVLIELYNDLKKL